jgi:hypothetical protein
MKPEFDRETDALLRDHARRGGARAAGDGAASFARDGLSSDRGVAFAEHLDADELNAFAENAAPEAARARFLSHIADCDDCRRAATGLALAANAALARDEPQVSKEKIAAASWRAWLAALFAPGAWRYAMPVVALLGVGVVALVLMKQVPLDNRGAAPQGEAQLANANSAEQGQRATVFADKQQPAQTSTQPQTHAAADAPAATNEVARRDADAIVNPVDAKSGGTITPVSPGAAKPGEGVGATAGASQSQVAQRRAEELQPPPAVASAPVLSATPAPPQSKLNEVASATAKEMSKSVKDEESAERAEARKKSRSAEPKRGEPSENAPPAPRASSRAALNSDDTSSADRSGGSRNRQLESRAREDRARDDKEKRGSEADDNSPTETRKVVGRKFRRQGDSWIDTAYNSSQATTVVRRNSEQYRALVADEPEIGRIASALGGEVVVVWKGRAYRIKP